LRLDKLKWKYQRWKETYIGTKKDAIANGSSRFGGDSRGRDVAASIGNSVQYQLLFSQRRQTAEQDAERIENG
jgi:hypothetical protein